MVQTRSQTVGTLYEKIFSNIVITVYVDIVDNENVSVTLDPIVRTLDGEVATEDLEGWEELDNWLNKVKLDLKNINSLTTDL